MGNIVCIITDRGISAAIHRGRLDARACHCREKDLLCQIAIVRNHQLTLIGSGLCKALFELSAARNVGDIPQLLCGERRGKHACVVFTLLDREVTIDAKLLSQPQLQGGGIEKVEIIAFIKTAQRRLVQRVRQVIVERWHQCTSLVVGIFIRVLFHPL